ncbi:murein biosynthesis integral membrane protein MurJ [Candidatus Dependentiae bacterium]
MKKSTKKNIDSKSAGVMHKKSIIQKTIEIGGFTMLSRVLGIAREVLLFRFLGGAGAMSDAFKVAYTIPNSFRKIFAEGALSAAMVPAVVSKVRDGNRDGVNSLMSLAFIVFEMIVLALCFIIIWHAESVVSFIAPGFNIDQVANTARWLKILMPFIFFLSSSALLASVLQSVSRFFVPAISPALLNVVFVASLLACLKFSFPVDYLCYFILFGGFLQLIFHAIAYFRAKFSFRKIDREAVKSFVSVFIRFLPCLLSMGIVEISLFIDTRFASYLTKGSVSLIKLSNRFMGIPLGVFAVALSTILLPHFSRIRIYAPKRMSFYLLEGAKFVFWVLLPVAVVMGFLSEDILRAFLYLTGNLRIEQVSEGSTILQAFLIGLVFFSFNKILLNIYYAFRNTWVPTIIMIFATVVNYFLNLLLMKILLATGIALATTISATIQTVLFLIFLYVVFGIRFHIVKFMKFFLHYLFQLISVFSIIFLAYKVVMSFVYQLSNYWMCFFTKGFGVWLWAMPLSMLTVLLIYYTRKIFRVKLYFLD